MDCISSPVNVDVDWFLNPQAPDFLICAKCFGKHIHGTYLQNAFQKKRFDDWGSVPRKCYFGVDRVKKGLWPRVVAEGRLDGMMEFLRQRPRIAECQQQQALAGCEWMVCEEIPGAVFCLACWSDEYEGGLFAGQFRREVVEGESSCASAMLFVGRLYELCHPDNRWQEFVAEVQGRLTIPACPGASAISGSSHAWMRSTRDPKGLQICYACYADYFYSTGSAEHFQQVEVGEETVCLMGTVNIKIPAQQSVVKKDPELFWKWMVEVDKYPFCSKKGIKGSKTWFTLPNHPPGFAVCGVCCAGIAEPVNWAKYLIPLAVDQEHTILCCFNIAHPRFGEFMQSLSQDIAVDNWEKLGTFAERYANVPRCPRDGTMLRSDRKWWGWQSLRICEECYLSFAKDTALERLFHLRGEVLEKARLCDLYSPRMRRLYVNACEGKMSGQELVDMGGERRMVYLNTMPEIDRLLSQQRIKASQAAMFGAMGSSYKFMGASQGSVGGIYSLGNGNVVNGLELTGMDYDRKGRDLVAEAAGGGVWAQTEMLERRWREVE